MSMIVTERNVLTDILKMYKDLPCLWEPSHQLYNNKEARDEAYVLLLEKYKLIQDDANAENVKKKIENMRCCYKREYKKVLKARANGEKYRPSLWYYKYLTFLDGVNDKSDDESDEETIEYKQDFSYEEPPVKKSKLSSIFLTEDDHLLQENEEMPISQDNAEQQEYLLLKTEAESFGKTIGLQLNQLRPVQRFIAEKLISDVIFYGRMDRLESESSVKLKKKLYND